MYEIYKEHKDEIREYCEQNGLSYEKACSMVKCFDDNTLLLQYFDPEKGKLGLLDETPMPVVLWVYREGDSLRFEQTEYTRKYLAP